MLTKTTYNREAATQYAIKWALAHNPSFYNFQQSGGDCTNFASQSIYAGSGIMNYVLFKPAFLGGQIGTFWNFRQKNCINHSILFLNKSLLLLFSAI